MGYNLGRVQIPPLPFYLVMTDRDDGSEWLLTHDSDFVHVGINSVVPTGFRAGQVRRYAAYDGPVLGGNPAIRLLIRGGVLGYEVVALQGALQDMDFAPACTRRDGSQAAFEVFSAGFINDGDRIGYYDLFGARP